jgi:non-ribosomal peptide synthase protein (TIGR01720 family)
VSELALVARKTKPVEAEQGTVTGAAPLTPIQHWFFEHNGSQPGSFNLAVMLETREQLDVALFEKALREVLNHHDALRLRFGLEDSGWRQWHAAAADCAVVSYTDLTAQPESEQVAHLEATLRMLQSEINLEQGPVARFAYFHRGEGRAARLLGVIHRLVADDLSWQILFGDLETAYGQLKSNQPVRLPRKTTSFKYWAERIREDARTETLKQEAGFWTDERFNEPSCLPLDYPAGDNTQASAERLVVSLGEEESSALRESVPHAFHVQISDLLMTALARTFTQWSGTDSFLAYTEGPGRETALEGVDLTRSVGWFDELFPTFLKLKPWESPGQTLRTIKEQLRQVPNWGVGYGRLRYLSEEVDVREKLNRLPQPEVMLSFRPLPQLVASDSTLFQTLPGVLGNLASHSLLLRPYLIEVRVFENAGVLQAEWTYSENLHRRETIAHLAEDFLAALRELIAHADTPDAGGYTPSDFPLAALNEEKLRKLERLLEESEE